MKGDILETPSLFSHPLPPEDGKKREFGYETESVDDCH